MTKRVVTRRAMYNETVEIQWQLDDGTSYWERYTLPPREVREVRIAARAAGVDEREAD